MYLDNVIYKEQFVILCILSIIRAIELIIIVFYIMYYALCFELNTFYIYFIQIVLDKTYITDRN